MATRLDNAIMLWFDSEHKITVKKIKESYIPKHDGLTWEEAESVLRVFKIVNKWIDFYDASPDKESSYFSIMPEGNKEITRIKNDQKITKEIAKFSFEYIYIVIQCIGIIGMLLISTCQDKSIQKEQQEQKLIMQTIDHKIDSLVERTALIDSTCRTPLPAKK